jgi:hypothetical protein
LANGKRLVLLQLTRPQALKLQTLRDLQLEAKHKQSLRQKQQQGNQKKWVSY